MIHEAYEEFFGKSSERELVITYGRLRGYNAAIRMSPSRIEVRASRQWKEVSPEIQKGLVQVLFARLFKVKQKTVSMDLYHHFVRSLPKVMPKKHNHPVLEESFNRVNEQLFGGLMQRPNLRLGKGINRLGTYEYTSDTVRIAEYLLEYPELMDYVMYHELLHKKHQYKEGVQRTTHHSAKFREDEARFPRAAELEKELQKLVQRQKGGWFW
ncbi:M48 family peptidase [Candidatus Woesearchaeota archaeon]|nr:MAG: M48 family peptidase [Candidatus Woesearchaeota archaeon]